MEGKVEVIKKPADHTENDYLLTGHGKITFNL